MDVDVDVKIVLLSGIFDENAHRSLKPLGVGLFNSSHSQIMQPLNIFAANAAELNKLYHKVHAASQRRGESAERLAEWQTAARLFGESYDRLAFPRGLRRQFELLKQGDLQAIEMALRFLEANPWYFRSGYHKADMLKLLRKLTLTEDQCARLRKLILDRVRARPVRELREYASLAPSISTFDFEEEIRNLASSSDPQTARNASRVLQCLKSAAGTKLAEGSTRSPRGNG